MKNNTKKSMEQKPIRFHNTPAFYREYTKNWLAKQKSAKANPAEIAIVEDIATLVEIAVNVLEPVPTESETNKNNENEQTEL